MFPRPLDSQLARKGEAGPIFVIGPAYDLRQVYPPRSGFKLARGTHLTQAAREISKNRGLSPLFWQAATQADKEIPVQSASAAVASQDVNRSFQRHRLRIMLAITLGYGFIYTCRLGLSIVKKP